MFHAMFLAVLAVYRIAQAGKPSEVSNYRGSIQQPSPYNCLSASGNYPPALPPLQVIVDTICVCGILIASLSKDSTLTCSLCIQRPPSQGGFLVSRLYVFASLWYNNRACLYLANDLSRVSDDAPAKPQA